ncbi:hypothetical protein, partial [Cereibacter azotoformans]|uniref:hypothetical protein n=1 Tax=Cereibacter azotoformans TaxID=43057 RepID=UPI0039A3D073
RKQRASLPSAFMWPISGSMLLRRRSAFASAGVRPRRVPLIRTYVGSDASALHRMRIVPYGYILRSVTKLKPFKDAAFGKSSEAVKHTLRIMVESGELAEMSKAVLSKDFNYAGNAYAIARPASFLE